MAYCINCGTQLDPSDGYCTNCGTKVDGLNITEEPTVSGSGYDGPTTPGYGAPVAPGYDTSAAPGYGKADYPNVGQTQVMGHYDSQPGYDYGRNSAAPVAPGAQSYQGFDPNPAPPRKPNTAAIAAIAAIVAIAAIAIAFFAFRGITADKVCRVQFETSGGTPVTTQEVSAGKTVTSPVAPTKEGYIFAGWYEDAACTKPVAFPWKVDADTVLYAKWESVEASAGQTSAGTTSAVSGQSVSSSSASTTASRSSSAAASSTESVVSITVVGSDGTTKTERIRRQGTTERVIPDSSTRRITKSEAAALTDAERCIAWNEIIAASNGYSFKNSGLRNYFKSCSWYSAKSNAAAGGDLSKVESDNVELLKSMTDKWWISGLKMS